jgi:hypothetical protein
LELRQSEVDVEPVSAAISAAEGRTVDGFLGYDFLSRFIVEIDYANRWVSVRDPNGFRYSGTGEVIPIEITRGNIFISTYLTLPDRKRASGTFMVDTGWRSALTLASPYCGESKAHDGCT